VQPHQIGANAGLWRPGVKLGVRPGSEFHLTECFGPVLGLMRADDLTHAIALANQPSYGLTGGIHSLDDREVARWCDEIEVGNAYVNRVITGAIVQRQPFGGWKRSAIGPGAKAGGRHYVASLGTWHAGSPDSAADQLDRARAMWHRLSVGDDPSGLRAETNRFRLRALRRVVVRLADEVDAAALRFALAVAQIVGVDVTVSTPIEDDPSFIARLSTLNVDKVRLLAAPGELGLAVIDAGFTLDTLGIVFDGELELLRWTREQVISETRHRHGNLRPPSP
jgi:RHH-type proline utilization regulon transcriptional repressor/proline dehydrogenase/delta 1-pyrroline-5-carboxylate dehydrogenase